MSIKVFAIVSVLTVICVIFVTVIIKPQTVNLFRVKYSWCGVSILMVWCSIKTSTPYYCDGKCYTQQYWIVQ